MRYLTAAIGFVLLVLISASIVMFQSVPQKTNTIAVHMGTRSYQAVMATTPAQWEQGLSDRGPLTSNEAMIFLFPRSVVQAFWMHHMRFDIDIVWVDERLNIVGAVERASFRDQETIFHSPVPVRYVLEVPSGDYEASGRPKKLVVDGVPRIR